MLRNIQEIFLDGLFNLETTPDILSVISEKSSRTAYDQFMSYRDSVIGGIIEALADSYPVVKKLVGEQFFNHISYQYIREHPSTSPDLNNYGRQFADFIDTLDSTESVPYLSDVARLEWAWQKIINGENSRTGNLHLLANLNENNSDNLIFKLNPHTSLVFSKYAIHKIWEVNQENVTINEDIKIDKNTNLLIWRNGLDMNMTVIEVNQLFFLELIHQDIYFSDICVQYHARYPEHDIGELLSHCIRANWIHSFILNP